MSRPTMIEIQATRRFPSDPERVFDAWLDPATARRFFFATKGGTMVRADVDARVGGKFRFVDRRDDKDVTHEGTYTEIARPRRLSFQFSVDGSPSTRVTIEVTPLETGSELILTHEMSAEWADHAEKARHGWATMLETLAGVLG